ncbi:phospholipase [Sporosarcina sp. P13]|uniref:phospholipase n=1 Tax=Sporosarcina sp. P13 TaxID=2048263 RepID=UPI000C162A0A|nr:phospholipase [Sporosarcina sp. P13]PIC63453.1 phospholipase [Sporosarcina sp. P13]
MCNQRNRGPRFCIFPGYNWCGPGCNGPGPPVNDVDAACRAHDICYRTGRSRCECDCEFMDRLYSEINPYTQEGRHARTLYNYMRIQSRFTCRYFRY